MALVSVEVYQQHKSLMIKLSDMMDPKDHTYQNFIYYLESYIPKGSLSTIQQNPTVVFSVMEETRVLEVGKYENLEKALEASGYMNILDVLKEEGENITKQLRKRDYSDGSIAGSSSYIDAATVSSIEPEERHNKKLRKLEKDIQEIKASISQGTDQVSAVKIESDISKLRDDLIKAYRNLRCVQVSPLFEKRRCNIDNIFVDLVIEAKHDRRNADGSKYGSTQRNNDQSGHKKTIEVTSYKQIFLDERCLKLFKRVYLRGKGGLGKTTFCRKVLHAWCNAHEGRPVSQDGFFQDEAILKLFDILFYLNLREVSVKTNLIEAICDQFPLEEVPSKDVLGNLLKINGDKVLFILDGLDEMVVIPRCIENVLTRRVYPKCCFLVSSRPWKMSQMELHEEMEIDLLLDLQGFSKQNAIKFAENIFNNCYNDGSAIREFEMDLYSNKLATQLFHVPLILLFMAQVWYENERSLPNKLHKLYILLLNLLTDRMMEKYKKDPTQKQTRFVSGFMQSSLPTKLSETSLVVNFGEEFLLSLCEVAYHFLLKGEMESSLVFEETNLLKAFGNRGKEKLDVALDLSILSVTDSISYLHRRTSVSFLHKTMQEFFTAVYFILSSEKLADFISSMTDLNAVKQNENSIVFLVGLMPELGNRVLEKVNELCKDDWERSNERLKMYRYGFHDISIIYLRCKEEVIGDEVQLNVFGLDLQQNYFNPQYWNPDFLQYLKITGFSNSSIVNYVLLDLKGLRKLKYLELSKLECDLYLPMSDSLSSLIMSNTTLSNSCCDVLGSSLQHYSKLKNLQICGTNLRNCLLDFSNMKELEDLYMLYVTLSSSCSDVLGRTLIHCTKLIVLSIHNTNLHNCLLDVSNMTELRVLDISKVILSCSCCEVLGTSLKHCPKLQILSITKTNLHNCLLDLSNMTELTALYMLKVILSSTCCNVLGSTMKHCTKLERLGIYHTDLHNTDLDLSNMTELSVLHISNVSLSSSCDILGSTLAHCKSLKKIKICNTDLNNCLLDLSNMTELTVLDLLEITLSISCCDVLGRSLTHCTKLMNLKIYNTDLHNCLLDLTDMMGLTDLDMSEVTLSSSCCDVLGSTLTHCANLKKLKIHKTDLHNCLLDFSNMTELTVLDISEITLSSSCCDVLGRTLTHCTKLETFTISRTNLHNCILDLSKMTELRVLDMMGVTLSSRCCDILGSTVTHCTKIMKFIIHKIDLHSCKLDLPKITELIDLDISEVTLSSNSCDALGSTLTHCTKLNMLSVHATDLHNCLLDLSNMTELIDLNISDVRLSSSCCDVLGKTLTHCTKLERLRIQKTDLSICLLDLSNMSELTKLDIAKATLSSNCCDVLCRTMTHCTKCNSLKIYYTDIHNGVFDFSNMIDLHLDFIGVIMSCNALQSFCSINRAYLWNLTLEKSQCDNDRWKVNLFDPDTFSDQEIYFNDSDRESFHDLYQ